MRNERFDIIIIGSGAGGGTIAHALAASSARILVLERGDFVPQEEENWDPEAVWKHLRYRVRERWLDREGREFQPYTHYCVGGNTKFWGSVLYRLRREDFQAVEHADGISPAWPIDYETLEPYYERAECRYHVRGQHGVDPTEPPRRPYPYEPVPHAPAMAAIVEQLRGLGLHPSPLPLGLLRPGEQDGCILCDTCNSFPCKVHAKSDSDVCCIRQTLQRPTVSLWTNAFARRLLTDPSGRKVEAVEVERNGDTCLVEAPLVIVSCGAVNSAALLLRSANATHPDGLANSSGLVGRRYMAHLATMMQGFHPFRRNETVFQKTVGVNDFYLHGPDDGYPAWTDSVAGTDPRRHGANGRAVDSGPGVRRVGVARGRLAGDVGGSPQGGQSRDGGAGRPHPAALSTEQPRGAPAARQGNQADSSASWLLGRGGALAPGPEYHPSVRHALLRHGSTIVRPGCLLPLA
jgi:choline dehydrogenase-like flavoprotein